MFVLFFKSYVFCQYPLRLPLLLSLTGVTKTLGIALMTLFPTPSSSLCAILYLSSGSAISNGREPKSCLSRVLNSKFSHIALQCNRCIA